MKFNASNGARSIVVYVCRDDREVAKPRLFFAEDAAEEVVGGFGPGGGGGVGAVVDFRPPGAVGVDTVGVKARGGGGAGEGDRAVDRPRRPRGRGSSRASRRLSKFSECNLQYYNGDLPGRLRSVPHGYFSAQPCGRLLAMNETSHRNKTPNAYREKGH